MTNRFEKITAFVAHWQCPQHFQTPNATHILWTVTLCISLLTASCGQTDSSADENATESDSGTGIFDPVGVDTTTASDAPTASTDSATPDDAQTSTASDTQAPDTSDTDSTPSTDSPNADTGTGVSPDELPFSGTATIFGPIVDARVDVYHVDNLADGPQCTVQTIDDDDISLAGTFHIPDDCLSVSGMMLLVMTGGLDVDVNIDGERDATPQPVSGVLHALLSLDQLMSENSNITPLTEFAFQSVAYALAAGYSDQEIATHLDNMAATLIGIDQNGDNYIDRHDFNNWHPANISGFLPGPAILDSLRNALTSGTDLTVEMERLFVAETQQNTVATFSEVIQPNWLDGELQVEDDVVVITNRAYRLTRGTDGNWGLTEDIGIDAADYDAFASYIPHLESNTDDALYKISSYTDPDAYQPDNNLQIFDTEGNADIPIESEVIAIAVRDSHLFVLKRMGTSAYGPPGLDVYDVSLPSSPTLVASHEFEFFESPVGWHVRDSEVVVACSDINNLDVIMVFDSDFELASSTTLEFDLPVSYFDMEFSASDNFFAFLDRSQPNHIQLVNREDGTRASLTLEKEVQHIDVSEDFIFALFLDDGMKIIEMGQPLFVPPTPLFRQIADIGNSLKVSPQNTLLTFLDLGTPFSVSGYESIIDNAGALQITEYGNMIKRTEWLNTTTTITCDAGVVMGVLSEGSWSLSQVDSMKVGDFCGTLFGDAQYIYVTGFESIDGDNGSVTPGDAVLSIHERNADTFMPPVAELVLETDMQFTSGALIGENLYLFNLECTYLVDVSNTAAPVDFGCITMPEGMTSLILDTETYSDNSVYFLTSSGIYLTNIEAPSSPAVESEYVREGLSRMVRVGDYLYAVGEPNVLLVFKIEENGALTLVQHLYLGMAPNDVAYWESMVWVSGNTKTVSLLPVIHPLP